jgi:hypothetical protein
MQEFTPKPNVVCFNDPRRPGQKTGVLGFYYPGHEEPCDKLCGGGFMGNFWELGKGQLRITAPDYASAVTFSNTEAAYQALKFWPLADRFAPLSGHGAFQLKRQLAGQEDYSCGGYGNTWSAMMAVLRVKFSIATMADALLRTEDAFLLEHNSIEGRDKVWSDNCKGDGTNWLGLQLMLIRDQLSGKNDWTQYISKHIDLSTGSPRSESSRKEWQCTVERACQAVVIVLARSVLDTQVQQPRQGVIADVAKRKPNEHRQDTAYRRGIIKSAAAVASNRMAATQGFSRPRSAGAGVGIRRRTGAGPLPPTY